MAGGKLTPRQKMINLMYLVFIAMLALNMSKEVLSAFGLLENKISEGTIKTNERTDAFIQNLALKASDSPEKYGKLKTEATEVHKISNQFYNYIEGIKNQMMATVPEEDRDNYEVQDKPDFLDTYFFRGDKLAKGGEEFVAKTLEYRDAIISVLGDKYPTIVDAVKHEFSMEPVTPRGKKIAIHPLNYHFEGFPLVASKTKLTQIQADIKNIENEILSSMLRGEQAASLKMSNYSTLLETTKSAYYAGEKFDGAIVLGRVDETTKPNRADLTLDGRKLEQGKDFEFQGGRVVLKVSAGNPGDHTIKGELVFLEDGKETKVPVNRTFATISKPNSAVIAADKMNVVYRAVSNPMTISIPGIPTNKVTASAPGLSKSGKGWVMKPKSGRTVKITASGTLPDGQRVSSSKEFRIKDLPRPTGTIRGEHGNGGAVRMQRQGIEKSSIGATLLDFDFDLKLSVTGFSFKVSGQPTVKVSGTKLNSKAKGALKRAKRGEMVQIFDIQAKISGNSGYKLKKISPVIIELTN